MNWYRRAQQEDLTMEAVREVLGLPPDAPDPEVMDSDAWFRNYRPVINTVAGEDRPWNNTMFETYGEEVEHVKAMSSKSPNNVWTMVESDGDNEDMLIVPGWHYVNRFAYFITEVPWKRWDMVVRE